MTRPETLSVLFANVIDQVPPRIRFEARRKAIHVAGALAAVVAYLVLPFEVNVALALGIIAVITISYFVRLRRVKVARPLNLVTDSIGDALEQTRRPGETFPWAPVSFALALLLIGSFVTTTGIDNAFAVAGFGILGMGDAASALIGIPYGRHKLPWNRKKSWEGTAAGFVVSFLSAVLLASVAFSIRGQVLPPEWLAVAFAGAFAGALVESVPNVEDNLFVPLAAVGAMVGVGAALGLL